MKQLLKLIIAATVVATGFFAGDVKAQTIPVNAFRFEIGAESGITTGAINYASNVYVGGTARLQYGVSKNFALTLTSGYYNFLGNTYHNSMGMIPVKLGFKFFVVPGFYFSGEAGVGFELQNFNVYPNLDNGIPKSTKLILSPGLGYATKSWDFGLRYENFSSSKTFAGENNSYGLIGLRVAYNFGL
jgi:hypothetical protein